MSKEIILPPLETYSSPTSITAVVFIIHKPSKSVLLFGNREIGLSGFIYNNPDNEIAIRSRVLQSIQDQLGISATECNLCCLNITENIEPETKESTWRLIFVLRDFTMNGTPEHAKWYPFNGLPLGKFTEKQDRIFLRQAIASS